MTSITIVVSAGSLFVAWVRLGRLGSLGPLAVIIQFSTSLAESLELTRKEKSCMFAAASPLMPKSCLTGSVID